MSTLSNTHHDKGTPGASRGRRATGPTGPAGQPKEERP